MRNQAYVINRIVIGQLSRLGASLTFIVMKKGRSTNFTRLNEPIDLHTHPHTKLARQDSIEASSLPLSLRHTAPQ